MCMVDFDTWIVKLEKSLKQIEDNNFTRSSYDKWIFRWI